MKRPFQHRNKRNSKTRFGGFFVARDRQRYAPDGYQISDVEIIHDQT